MFGLITGVALVVGAIAIRVVLKNAPVELQSIRSFASYVVGVLGIIVAMWGSVSYNDAGYCQHVRTIFGNEDATCETGWYFSDRKSVV